MDSKKMCIHSPCPLTDKEADEKDLADAYVKNAVFF